MMKKLFNMYMYIKDTIGILKNVIIYDKYAVIIYLIKNMEICRKNVLSLLYMYALLFI